MTAYQILKGTGERPPQFIRANDLDIETAIVDYGANKSNKIFNNVQQPMEGIVNGLLHPDEKKRTTPFDLLNSTTFFQTPGFGSPEVRELMKSLAKGDSVATIRQQSDAIDNIDKKTDGDRRVKLYMDRKGEVLGQAMEATGLV